MIASLGVAAGVDTALGPLAAAYVLLLALAGPIVMRYDHRLLGFVDLLDALLERGPLRGPAGRVLQAEPSPRAKR